MIKPHDDDTRPHKSVTTSHHDKSTKNNVTTSIHHDKTTPHNEVITQRHDQNTLRQDCITRHHEETTKRNEATAKHNEEATQHNVVTHNEETTRNNDNKLHKIVMAFHSLRPGSGMLSRNMVGQLYLFLYLFTKLNFSLILELDALPCFNILSWPREMSRDRFVKL